MIDLTAAIRVVGNLTDWSTHTGEPGDPSGGRCSLWVMAASSYAVWQQDDHAPVL
jgi:hypothetical protein